MKLSSGKKQNFPSWESSSLVAAYQVTQIIKWQIKGIFLLYVTYFVLLLNLCVYIKYFKLL